MKCNEIEAFLIDYFSGELDSMHKAELERHLQECGLCRKESEELKMVWESVASLPDVQPSIDVKNRFYEQLKRLKTSEAEIHPAHSFRQILFNRRTINTCIRTAAVLLIFFAGAVSGYLYNKANIRVSAEITNMQMEIKKLNRLVSLSLLQNSSPSSRLMGVEWIYKLDYIDTTIVDALITTLEDDPNVNVRFSALDALSLITFPDIFRIRIIRSLDQQDSPIIQNALIDLILFYGDKRAVDTFKKVLNKDNLDLYIQNKLEAGLAMLQ
jgi:hypothetical protein